MSINGMDEWLKKIESLKVDFPNAWQRKNGGSFKQIVYNNTSYASHIEFGHRIIRGKKVVGIVRGRHMLHKGVNRVRMTFYRDLEIMYKNLISR